MHPISQSPPQPLAYRVARFILVWLSILLALPACRFESSRLPVATPSPSPTLMATASATPTTVWFPPTATYTPAPTAAFMPTPEQPAVSGEILFTDNFSQASLWLLGRTTSTSIALGKNVLTLALNQPGGYLYSLRSAPALDDFYLEITASPSLCRGQDEYGVLLRVSQAHEFYRFSLSCDGQTRLDKYFSGKASSPQPWMLSGAVPPGAPSSSRLAVWALGNQMRFYINAELQFSVNDPSLTAGTIGVFARSAGETAVTISFSDLVVREAMP